MNKEQPNNLYEGMYILNAGLSDDAIKKAAERITSGIEKRQGEIVKIHDQGRRKLAYDIKGHRQGYYYLIYFKSPPAKLKELWEEYHLNEDLIRYLTMRTESVMETLEFKPITQE